MKCLLWINGVEKHAHEVWMRGLTFAAEAVSFPSEMDTFEGLVWLHTTKGGQYEGSAKLKPGMLEGAGGIISGELPIVPPAPFLVCDDAEMKIRHVGLVSVQLRHGTVASERLRRFKGAIEIPIVDKTHRWFGVLSRSRTGWFRRQEVWRVVAFSKDPSCCFSKCDVCEDRQIATEWFPPEWNETGQDELGTITFLGCRDVI